MRVWRKSVGERVARGRVQQWLAGVFLLLIGMGAASAQCVQNGRGDFSWSVSTAGLDASAASGTVLRSQTINVGGGNLICGPTYRVSSYTETVSATTGGATGVYWRVSRNGSVVSSNSSSLVTAYSASPNTGTYTVPSPTAWKLELVRSTGAITAPSGSISLPTVRGVYGTTDPVNTAPYFFFINGGRQSISVSNSTCTVSTTSASISLGNVAASGFASVGSTSTTSGTQNISLSCGGFPSVRMTLQGTPVTGTTNVLPLTGAGTAGVAQGIGVQLLYNGSSVLTVGTALSLTTAAPTGTLNVPVAARYYRTGNVTAGRANVAATVRFDYN